MKIEKCLLQAGRCRLKIITTEPLINKIDACHDETHNGSEKAQHGHVIEAIKSFLVMPFLRFT